MLEALCLARKKWNLASNVSGLVNPRLRGRWDAHLLLSVVATWWYRVVGRRGSDDLTIILPKRLAIVSMCTVERLDAFSFIEISVNLQHACH